RAGKPATCLDPLRTALVFPRRSLTKDAVMTRVTAPCALAFLAALALNGCGTLHNLEEGEGRIYGGVRAALALSGLCVIGGGPGDVGALRSRGCPAGPGRLAKNMRAGAGGHRPGDCPAAVRGGRHPHLAAHLPRYLRAADQTAQRHPFDRNGPRGGVSSLA